MTVEWRGNEILARVMQSTMEAVTVVSRNAADTAAVLNAARRYDTGRMAEGWEPIPTSVVGHIVKAGFRNEVRDPRSGFHYPAIQDRGGRYIEPANISADSMDQSFPALESEIRARINL